MSNNDSSREGHHDGISETPDNTGEQRLEDDDPDTPDTKQGTDMDKTHTTVGDTVAEDDSDSDSDSEGNEHDEEEEDTFDNDIKEQSAVFRGYNIDDPEDIIAAINDVEPEAANNIRHVFNEKERLESEVDALSEQLEDVQEEFQRYKARKEKQIEALEETAAKEFVKDILPVRDNLERTLEHDDIAEVKDGIEMITEKFDEALSDEGVDIISPNRGDPVDPQVHQVMSRVKADDVEEGHIVECHRPGYRIEDLLIRPARVSVSDE